MERFGKFEIIEEIARGGMGIVYKVVDPDRAGVVALKVLIAGDEAPEKTIQRFYQEAEAISRLQHPNIVKVLEIGEIDGRHYYTMNYIDGLTLDEVIKKGGLKESDTAHLIKEVASALSYCHTMNIIHRDIKTSNIIVDKKTWLPKVLDFGVAKDLVMVIQLTAEEEVLGTPQYMSPEQAAGDNVEVDHRTDIYSLGVVLYEMLTGRVPITADNYSQMIVKVIQGEKELPSFYNPQVNKQLEAICLKMMARKKEDRYKNASDIANDLANYQEPKKCIAKQVTIVDKSLLNVKKYAAFILSGIITFIILLGIGLGAIGRWQVHVQRRDSSLNELKFSIDKRLKKIQGEDISNNDLLQHGQKIRSYLAVMEVLKPGSSSDIERSYKRILEKKLEKLIKEGQSAVSRKAIPQAYIIAYYVHKLDNGDLYENFEKVKDEINLKRQLNSILIESNVSALNFKLYTTRGAIIQSETSAETGIPIENLASGKQLFLLESSLHIPMFKTVEVGIGPVKLYAQLAEKALLPQNSFVLYKQNEENKILPYLGVDRKCITNQEYYDFLKLNGKNIPAKFSLSFLHSNGKKPVLGLSVKAAEEFAAWKGKRLPTKADWDWIILNYSAEYYPTRFSNNPDLDFIHNFLKTGEPELIKENQTVSLTSSRSAKFRDPRQEHKIRLVWEYNKTKELKSLMKKQEMEMKEFYLLIGDLEYNFQNFLQEVQKSYETQSEGRRVRAFDKITTFLKSQGGEKNIAKLCKNKLQAIELIKQIDADIWQTLTKQLKKKIKIKNNKTMTLLSVNPEAKTFRGKLGRKNKNFELQDLALSDLLYLFRNKAAVKQSTAIVNLFAGKRDEGTSLIRSLPKATQKQFGELFPIFAKKFWPSFHEAQNAGYIFNQGKNWYTPTQANQLGFYYFNNAWIDAAKMEKSGKLLLLEKKIYSPLEAKTLGYIFKNGSWKVEEQYWGEKPNATSLDVPDDPKAFTAATFLDNTKLVLGSLKGEIIILDIKENKILKSVETNMKKGIFCLKNDGDFGISASGAQGEFQVFNPNNLKLIKKFPDSITKEYKRSQIINHVYFPEKDRVLTLTDQDQIHITELSPPSIIELQNIQKKGRPLTLTLDGTKVLFAFAKDDKLFFLRDYKKFDEKTKPIPTENSTRQKIIFSPNQYKFGTFTIGATGTFLKVCSISLQPETLRIEVGEIIEAIAFNASGNILALATQIGTIRLYNLKTAVGGKIGPDQFLQEFKIKPNASSVQTEFLLFNSFSDTLIAVGKVDGVRQVIRWEN